MGPLYHSEEYDVLYYLCSHLVIQLSYELGASHAEVLAQGRAQDFDVERAVAETDIARHACDDGAGYSGPCFYGAVLVKRCFQPFLSQETQDDILQGFYFLPLHVAC